VRLLDRAHVARMPGSSIAAPTAVGWVTDFLNAAYFARSAVRRNLDDLRLAFAILTTRWQRKGARDRLGARDVVAFHRAFGMHRLRGTPRLTLDRPALLGGAASLLGDWFVAAVADLERRAHGIAFPTVADREAFDPSARLVHAALGALAPPERPAGERHWSDYAPVPLASADRTAALMLQPERWPDVAAEAGRFTALRRGGLRDQTFEIEIIAIPAPRAPVYTRGYVTATRVLQRGDPGMDAFVDALTRDAGTPACAHDADVHLAVELTTHTGHFLGRGRSNLLVWEDADGAWLRDVGAWDPLPAELAAPYRLGGDAAQHAFWGPDDPERSMLVQIARASA
jgi:hypothetical protein